MNVMKTICGDLKDADDIMVDMAQKTVKERLAHTLLYLGEAFGTNADDSLKLQLSREEIASIIGTATESCIRLLSEFNKLGMIELAGKKIILNIPEPATLIVRDAIEKALRENKGIGSIFITGSRSFLIAQYLDEKGLRSINHVGYDLLDLNVKFLKSGATRFLIGQRPEEQTYKGIKKLFEFLSLHKIPDKIEYLPVDIVTSENVDFFL